MPEEPEKGNSTLPEKFDIRQVERERERENDDDCKAYDDYKIRTDLNLKTELTLWLLHFTCQKKSLNDIELKVINSIRNQHIEDIAENLIQ